ncbi:DUF4405 domain-containing protein [Planctomycetota bacterium]
MKKTNINLVIDALLLLCIAAIAGIGLLMKYVLVPGYLRWEIYGRNVSLFFQGLDRHQWGTIHFIVGLVMLGLLVLHVFLHWQMVVNIYRGFLPNRIARWIVALLLACVTIVLLVFPYLVKPEVVDQGRGLGHGSGAAVPACDIECNVKCDTPKSP